MSTAAPGEDAEQAVQSYQLNQQDLDLYIDCLVSWTSHCSGTQPEDVRLRQASPRHWQRKAVASSM